MTIFTRDILRAASLVLAPIGLALSLPATAQMQSVDPDEVIDADLMDGYEAQPAPSSDYDTAYELDEATPRYSQESEARPVLDLPPEQTTYADAPVAAQSDLETVAENAERTYGEDDLIGAAEGLFGDGAEGLAMLIQDILEDQGEPNGYIVGREGGGAFILGLRYGSGTLFHSVEGNMPVYWTGPSIGADVGANAGNTFVLVYNLYDTDDLYERFPAGEGNAYFVGGLTASYVRKGDVVLIPIRVGAGLRLGVNAGYMRFSREQRWLPF